MKKLTIVLTVFFLVFTMGLSAQDLNDAGKAYNQGIELTKENKTMEAIEKYQKCADIASELGDVGELGLHQRFVRDTDGLVVERA